MKNKLYKIRILLAAIIGVLSILAISGVFYPLKIMDMQFVPLFQRVLIDFSIVALLLFFLLIIFTIFFGRLYCSVLCPFGILQEFFGFVFSFVKKYLEKFIPALKSKKNSQAKNMPFKYFICAISFGILIGGSALVIRYLDPYTIFGSLFSFAKFGIIAAIIVLLIVFFKDRFFLHKYLPCGCDFRAYFKSIFK